MTLTKGRLLQPQGLTTVERDLLTLAGVDSGRLIYNETTNHLQQWTGSAWIDVLNQTSNLDGTKLTGTVSGVLVDSLDGAKLTGSVDGALVTQLAGSKLTGDVDGGLY